MNLSATLSIKIRQSYNIMLQPLNQPPAAVIIRPHGAKMRQYDNAKIR